jgi:hypothetical protein
MNRSLLLITVCALAPACVGSTGGDLVSFDAAAAGPSDAVAGQPLTFDTNGYHVALTRARLHVGALYLNKARPISGAQDTNCILPGIYVAEVTAGTDVDLLSPALQWLPNKGEGISQHAIVGEVWLMHGDVNAPDDPAPVLEVEGTAEKEGATYPFDATITIGQNRRVPVTNPALPSQHPICKERIVSPIVDVDVTPQTGGSLLVRVDPRQLFTNVDFAQLDRISESPPFYRFKDATQGQPNINLYRNLHSTSGTNGVYTFQWIDSTKT